MTNPQVKLPGTFGYVDNKQVFIPEKKFNTLPENHYSKPMHGCKFVVAVFDGKSNCVGWKEV